MAINQETLETAVERLVRELGQLVQSADPERQNELKELASALLEQELTPLETTERATRGAASRPMNPLAAGLGLCVLSVGFFFLIPSMGIVLGIIGFAGVVWGAVTSLTKK
jgi:hypothetical protein